ncbi:MAG: metal ABC transporter ATP-binding protein [Oscillospiraceae bacterium]|nr:metal ABC transporter ATP-binding protein [Oscillospiraceae bacterium]
MPQIACHNLTIGYEGKAVVSGLNFSLDPGDYLCVVGENGSGKSTLMKVMLNLKPPMSGKLVTGSGLRSNEIGYLPQQTPVQKDFPASVTEVVRSGCLNRRGLRPFYSQAEKNLARRYMDKLGISDIAKRCYRELSGGQQQRVLLARALCAARKIILLDEPAAGLDPMAGQDMYALISKLNSEGITVIMVSHDIPAAVKYAGKILHIGKQSSLFFGQVKDYLKTEIGRVYAGLEEEA